MAGTNVVNQGQQAFTPTISGTWTINLLLFDLTVHTTDAVTGSSLHGTAELVFPDSSSRTAPIGRDGSAQFTGLPRGSYVVKLNTDGIAPTTPIALSRSQEATIRVISTFDIGLAVAFVVLSLLALLWIGRRRQLGWLMRVSAVPMGLVRRMPGGSAIVSSGPTGPAATSPVTTVRTDLARLGKGRGSAAIDFARMLVTNIAGGIIGLFGGAGRGAVAATRPSTGSAAPEGAGPGDAVSLGPTPPDTQHSTLEPTPAWPTSASGDVDVRTVLHPPVVVRPAARSVPRPVQRDAGSAAVTTSWFEEPRDEEGPSHECARCHRQVLDSARFCRSCGHRQQ
jgi:hypothetical protein